VRDFTSSNINSWEGHPKNQKKTQKNFYHYTAFLGTGHAKLAVCAAGHDIQG